jgi:hypothetical protein
MDIKRMKLKDDLEDDQDRRLEHLLSVLPVCFKILAVDTTTSLLAQFAASAEKLQEAVSHDLPSLLCAPLTGFLCKSCMCGEAVLLPLQLACSAAVQRLLCAAQSITTASSVRELQ